MRYSRMLEESSFANRKADYFWLLFLSSLMLLVRAASSPSLPSVLTPAHLIIFSHPLFSLGPLPTLQPPLPLLAARLCANLLLVTPAPFDTDLAFRSAHHHSALPPLCARRILMGAHGHVARCCKRPRRVRGGPYRVVHA